jgi:hypothetical protein
MNLVDIIRQRYESSSSVTWQYTESKKKFVKILNKYFGKENVIVKSCPHFEFSGFIKRNNKYVYFATGDLRWMSSMLVRTAKDDRDFTGGRNYQIDYNSEDFDGTFAELVTSLTN